LGVYMIRPVRVLLTEGRQRVYVAWLVEDLNSNDIVHLDQLLREIGQCVDGELDVCWVIEEILLSVRDSRVTLAVLGARCTVHVYQYTETVLFGPVDSADDPWPRVDVGVSYWREHSVLTVDWTQAPTAHQLRCYMYLLSDRDADGVDAWSQLCQVRPYLYWPSMQSHSP
jgi:hypothetical protein